jgi:hypothetical protein
MTSQSGLLLPLNSPVFNSTLTLVPPLLKTRRPMRRNEARELWLKLKALDWKQVEPLWGAGVAI